MAEVTVLELRRAWRAIQSGQFADPAGHRRGMGEWTPADPVVPVLGVHGQCGASTVALALATRAAPARVVECASGPSCGLIGASTSELGVVGDGWTRGLRGDVVIDRSTKILLGSSEVPVPAELDRPVARTVVDAGWELIQVLSASSWLSSLILGAPCVVVVAVVSVPSLRRLENTLSILDGPACVAAVVGPPWKRWPRSVTGVMGARTRELIEMQRLVSVPPIAALRLAGLTTQPLPKPVLEAAGGVLQIVDGLVATSSPNSKDS